MHIRLDLVFSLQRYVIDVNPKEEAYACASFVVEIFNRRLKYEDDFFSAFELDASNYLVSFFWRDKQMLDDYVLFGDLVVLTQRIE